MGGSAMGAMGAMGGLRRGNGATRRHTGPARPAGC